MERKFGLMELSMKEIGKRTKQTARVNSGMQTVMYMKENGQTTKPMAMVFIFTLMALDTKGTGKMICRMDMVWSPGQMDPSMKENTRKE